MVYIISEIASAHNGSSRNLEKLINYAIKSKADAVKIQIFKTSKLLQKKHKNYDFFKKIEIPHFKIGQILNKIKKKKIQIILEPYDLDSLDYIKKNIKNYHAIKIPTSDAKNIEFIKKICKLNKKTLLGTAGLNKYEIKKIIKIFSRKKIILIEGFQNFPTNFLNVNFTKLKLIKKIFKCEVGYADHSDSKNIGLSYSLSSLAIINGASIIEKHLILDRKKKYPDYESGLSPNEFKEFVYFFKKFEYLNKNRKFKIDTNELIYKNKFKKYLVASKNIEKGSIIRKDDISFKRVNKPSNYFFDEIKSILGKKLVNKKKPDSPFSKKDF